MVFNKGQAIFVSLLNSLGVDYTCGQVLLFIVCCFTNATHKAELLLIIYSGRTVCYDRSHHVASFPFASCRNLLLRREVTDGGLQIGGGVGSKR